MTKNITLLCLLLATAHCGSQSKSPTTINSDSDAEYRILTDSNICIDLAQTFNAFIVYGPNTLILSNSQLYNESMEPLTNQSLEFTRCFVETDSKAYVEQVLKDCNQTWVGCVYTTPDILKGDE